MGFFRRKRETVYKKRRNLLEEDSQPLQDQPEQTLYYNDGDGIEEVDDIMDYNIYKHEQEMKKRRQDIIDTKRRYQKRLELKEHIFQRRQTSSSEDYSSILDHSDCNSPDRSIVFGNLTKVKYPAIVTFDYEEYNGYAFGYESCTGRGAGLEECLREIALDLRYPLQDFYNENGYIPSYTRSQILNDGKAQSDINNGAKIKLVEVEIDTNSLGYH